MIWRQDSVMLSTQDPELDFLMFVFTQLHTNSVTLDEAYNLSKLFSFAVVEIAIIAISQDLYTSRNKIIR